MNKEELAPQLYLNYADSMQEQLVSMSEWHELSEKEKLAWLEVARFVIMDIVL